MESFLKEYFSDLPVNELILSVLFVTIGIMFILAILFAGSTVLLRIANTLKYRRFTRLENSWKTSFLDFVNGEKSKFDVWKVVKPFDSLIFVNYLLKYSRGIKGVELEKIKELSLPYLDAIVDQLKSPASEVRARAVQTLGTLGIQKYKREVILALDDSSPLVEMVAARSLCREKSPELALPVIANLDKFENWSQGFLVSMLSSIGSDITPALRESLRSKENSTWVRVIAVETLRELKDLKSAEIAFEIVNNENDPDLLKSSLRLLSVVGTKDHLAAVRKHSESKNIYVRAQAINTLGVIGTTEDTEVMINALQEDSYWIASYAAVGLKNLGKIGLLQQLVKSNHKHADLLQNVLTIS